MEEELLRLEIKDFENLLEGTSKQYSDEYLSFLQALV